MLASNLAFGAQACYRGPRLYDTEATRAVVVRWVTWFKQHRAILESDVVHCNSRRACGRGLDWVFHGNPELPEKGMLVVFNPLAEARTQAIRLDLSFCGIGDRALCTDAVGQRRELALDGSSVVDLPVTVPAQGIAWFVFATP
jgi:hypothetical protein